MNRPMRPLVAVDWGTSTLRGALLDESGEVRETRQFPRGIMTVATGEFTSVFNDCFGDWMHTPGVLCLISGMAGSRQGWQEAPYCPCPAGFAELSQHLHWIEPDRIALVPGLSWTDAGSHGIPDVMRGEEIQIFGVLQSTGRDSATFVLPGTHSKWATVQNHQVTQFQTYMTGELYALLSQHSILAKTMDLDSAFESDAFLQGIEQSQTTGSVLHHLFAVRTLGLFAHLPTNALPSYLSGLLIGEELRAQCTSDPVGPVILMGSDALISRYALGLRHLHIDCETWGAQATWSGLFALAYTWTRTT